MEEKQIRRFLRREFRSLGWALIIYYGILNIMVTVVAMAQTASVLLHGIRAGRFPEITEQALLGNGWGYILSIAIGTLILICWKGVPFWCDEIWAKGRPMKAGRFFGILAVFLGMQLASSLLTELLNAILGNFDIDIMEQYEQMELAGSDSFSMFLYGAILAPISEEILFRGAILRSLQPYGKKFAIIISALLFGLFHGNLVQTPFAFAVGLIFAYVAVEYSIGWSMVLHMINNLVLADLMTRLTGIMPEVIGMAIESLVIWGFGIAAVVVLAVNFREILAYWRREQMDSRCTICFFSNSGIIVFLIIFVGSMIATTLIA